MPRALAAVIVAALVLCADVHAGARTGTTPITVHVTRGGFSFADAAVGAVAGAGTVVTTVGLLSLRRLRREETHHTRRGDAP